MDHTASGARNVRFSGTRHVYDRREVDEYLAVLADSLEEDERDLAAAQRRLESLERALEVAHSKLASVQLPQTPQPGGAQLADLERRAADLRIDALAEAARIRRHAEEDAADAAATSGGERAISPASGSSTYDALVEEGMPSEAGKWRKDLELRIAAETVSSAAQENARRMLQTAEQRVALRLEQVDGDRAAALFDLEKELASSRAIARRDSERLVSDAGVESDRILEEARREASRVTDAARRRVQSLERRVRQIRSSLRDLEMRFQTLTTNTLAEFSMLGDLIDLDDRGVDDLVVDESNGSPPLVGIDEPVTTGRGFYERRMAGLRSRIEAQEESPPET